MTADEARELMNGSMKYKGFIFKTRLTWICGRINSHIESAAESGEAYYIYTMDKRDDCKHYFPLIAQFYEDLGYFVTYSIYRKALTIFWGWDTLSRWKQTEFLDDYDDHQTEGMTVKEK